MEVITNQPEALTQLIERRLAQVAVVGAGYVGLGAAVQAAHVGYQVTAIDLSPERVQMLSEGRSYIGDIPSRVVKRLVDEGRLSATTDFDVLADADVILICVPTPLTQNRVPDLTSLQAATREVAQRLRPGQLIALESTTYPGTTEEEVLPALSRRGLQVGRDFFVVYCPERIDPGNPDFHVGNLVRVLGSVTSACHAVGSAFYQSISAGIKAVTSPRTAELAKLFENLYRATNIALVNELAMLCDRMNLDVWEVISASASKPFGIQAFWPGPGVGGHCIPLDPLYLSWKANEYDVPLKFVALAEEINRNMPYFVVNKLTRLLNRRSRPLRGARVLVLGVAYKRDVADVREAPSLRIIRLLIDAGAHVSYHDPLVPVLTVPGDDRPAGSRHSPIILESSPLDRELLRTVDACLIVTDHSSVDYNEVIEQVPLLLDTRGITTRLEVDRERVFRL